MSIQSCDFLVIGSGIAGLTFALEAARHGHVVLATKRGAEESNSRYAQGGIAAVLDPDDSFDEHIADTLAAASGLCIPGVVEMCVREGPARIEALLELGVRFSRHLTTGGLSLGREGGHSHRRVAHAGDITGEEIIRAMLAAARDEPNITLLEQHIAVDLVTRRKLQLPGPDRCLGAYLLDIVAGIVLSITAQATVLATGGAGKVYLYTSNPDTASGDGVAMAYRAGASIANMEFFQFHPTCLYHPEAKSFLISEALRGEGGILRLADGTPFMDQVHPLGSLAPRDVVARAIDFELKRTGHDSVFLDMAHLDSSFLRQRFPNIHARCLQLGIDMTCQPIPVVPAAHFMCGGVQVDRDGQSSIPGLFAVGEVSCTGMHGANRLASNSLLEGAVYGYRAAGKAISLLDGSGASPVLPVPPWDTGAATDSDEMVVVTQNWDEVRRCMWNYVGIVRSSKRLQRALRRVEMIAEEIQDYYWNFLLTSDLIELRNLATVAELIIRSALLRKESRGLHYTIDFPQRDDEDYLHDTLLQRWPEDDPGPACPGRRH
ncbi:MAG: L-aspartate oxidase [Deltaproteobacteria bacterium]|nr:L-aspartate oxidase [Deltaproteobacteria bacterium]